MQGEEPSKIPCFFLHLPPRTSSRCSLCPLSAELDTGHCAQGSADDTESC